MSKSATLNWRRATVGFLCAVLLPLAGCGGGKGIVTGTVTYQDKALPGGYITFVPETGGGAFRGKIDKDGRYRVENVPVGKVKIAIQALTPPKFAAGMIPPSQIDKVAKGELPPITDDPSTYPQLPSYLADSQKSDLSYIVTSGSQEHNIPLK